MRWPHVRHLVPTVRRGDLSLGPPWLSWSPWPAHPHCLGPQRGSLPPSAPHSTVWQKAVKVASSGLRTPGGVRSVYLPPACCHDDPRIRTTLGSPGGRRPGQPAVTANETASVELAQPPCPAPAGLTPWMRACQECGACGQPSPGQLGSCKRRESPRWRSRDASRVRNRAGPGMSYVLAVISSYALRAATAPSRLASLPRPGGSTVPVPRGARRRGGNCEFYYAWPPPSKVVWLAPPLALAKPETIS